MHGWWGLTARGRLQALANLARYVVEPEQAQLQRKHYDAAGNYAEPASGARKSGTQMVRALRAAKTSAKIGLYSFNSKVSRGVQRLRDSLSSD